MCNRKDLCTGGHPYNSSCLSSLHFLLSLSNFLLHFFYVRPLFHLAVIASGLCKISGWEEKTLFYSVMLLLLYTLDQTDDQSED